MCGVNSAATVIVVVATVWLRNYFFSSVVARCAEVADRSCAKRPDGSADRGNHGGPKDG